MIPSSFQTIVSYEPKYQALVCLLCHHAIGCKNLEKHLIITHKIDFQQHTLLRTALPHISAVDHIKDISIPLDDQEPIEGLLIYDGYKCDNCDDMKTINLRVMHLHRYEKHRQVSKEVNWSCVSL